MAASPRSPGSTVNFLPSFAISDTPSLPEFGRDSLVNSVYMSDYDMAAATPGAFHVIWSDNRDDLPGGAARKDPNVYYKKIALGLAVATTTPAAGSIVSAPPASYQVVFSDPIEASTLDASDFTVNGDAGDGSHVQSPDEDRHLYLHHQSRDGRRRPDDGDRRGLDSSRRGAAEGILEFSATFRFDAVALSVVSTAPPFPGGVFTLPGPFTYDVTFNEPIDPASVQTQRSEPERHCGCVRQRRSGPAGQHDDPLHARRACSPSRAR